MLVTLFGIITLVKAPHEVKAELPMLVTPSEICTVFTVTLFQGVGLL